MIATRDELAARRRALIAESDALRDSFAVSAEGMSGALGFFDLGYNAGRAIAQRPVLVLGLGAAALLLVGPRRILRSLSLVLTGLSAYYRIRGVMGPRAPGG